MDIEPIYELQARLRAAAIAGVNLRCEDFRLKRAAEAVKPLAGASPVFAKIDQQMAQLLDAGCPNPAGALLDAISLVDAVVCTLGTVEVTKEIQGIENETTGNDTCVIINAPYSTLKALLDALTTSGNGHYGYVCETHEKNPELFQDYRVKAAMVKALDAPYADLANQVEEWLKESGETILPLLMKDFDPKGKKGMARRVRIISDVAKAAANDFYVRMLETAEKEVREELIYALRFDKANEPLLLDMEKSERGKSKQLCLRLLACIDSEEGIGQLRKLAGKKPLEVVGHLQYADSEQATALVADILSQCIEDLLATDVNTASKEELQGKRDLYGNALMASVGKNSDALYQCYRAIMKNRAKLTEVLGDSVPYQKLYVSFTRRAGDSRQENVESGLASILQQSWMFGPNEELKSLIMELSKEGKPADFLQAVLTVQISDGAECLGEDLLKGLFQKRFANEKAAEQALEFIAWDDDRGSYCFKAVCPDQLRDRWEIRVRPFDFKMRDKVTEILRTHPTERSDAIMAGWCGRNVDTAYCRKLGEYFYKKALTLQPSNMYLAYMGKCGWTDCKGLGVRYLNCRNDAYPWSLFSYIQAMPCDDKEKAEEIRTICDQIRSGKLKAKNIKPDEFEALIEKL